jgi:hypothetical protein
MTLEQGEEQDDMSDDSTTGVMCAQMHHELQDSKQYSHAIATITAGTLNISQRNTYLVPYLGINCINYVMECLCQLSVVSGQQSVSDSVAVEVVVGGFVHCGCVMA